jgi:hypothetical protein
MSVLVVNVTVTPTPVPSATVQPNLGGAFVFPPGYNGTVYQDHEVVYSPPGVGLAASPTPAAELLPTITIGGKEVGIPWYVYVGALLLAFGGIYWLLAGSYQDLQKALRASARKL